MPTITCPLYYARMYVDQTTADDREKWHNQVKLVELFDKLKKPVLLYADYTSTNFHDLHTTLFTRDSADGVRIYFAAFPNDSTNPLVPRNYEGAVTVLYAPCSHDTSTNSYTDLGKYYLVHPYQGVTDIGYTDAKKWIDDFRGPSNILNSLTDIVKKYVPSPPPYPYHSDTKCMIHTRRDFNDFLTEIDCHDVFQIRAKFSSYHDHETLPEARTYMCRTIMVYELIDVGGNVINIKTPGRKPQPITKTHNSETVVEDFSDDFNNGQLCPPDINCAGGI